jgi:hypothetical protein
MHGCATGWNMTDALRLAMLDIERGCVSMSELENYYGA